jgi:hypothetical protein
MKFGILSDYHTGYLHICCVYVVQQKLPEYDDWTPIEDGLEFMYMSGRQK